MKLRLSLMAVVLSILAACNWPPQEQQRQSQTAMPAGPIGHLSTVPLSYADVVEQVAPAVVTVRSSRRVRAPQQYPFMNDPLFGRFFGMNPQSPRTEVERALGSGVIVRADGHILTNQHVIDGAQDIQVDLNDHRTLKAQLVGADKPSDLAVLKIDTNNLPVLQLGDSDKTRVGDICLAVGNPLGVGQTVTSGIISAKGRRTGLSNGAFEDFLQTDAPINQGNSGGALVNTTGALIGINSQIISTTGGSIGLGFAIPSNMARTVMDQLIQGGKVQRGHLGVVVQPITSTLAQSLGEKQAKGVLVNQVEPNGPAAQAGLKVGDVITQFNGHDTNDPNTFRNEVAQTAPGTQVTLTVTRDGKEQQLKATLSDSSNLQQTASGQNGGGGAESGGRLGVTVQPLTPDIASQLNLPGNVKGLVVTQVDPMGPAADAGLQAGDVIEQINHQPVQSTADVGPALEKSGSAPALLLVSRQGQNVFLSIKVR